MYRVATTLTNARIDHRYSELIQNIYKHATLCVRLHRKTRKFKVARGVSQKDTVSPKIVYNPVRMCVRKDQLGKYGSLYRRWKTEPFAFFRRSRIHNRSIWRYSGNALQTQHVITRSEFNDQFFNNTMRDTSCYTYIQQFYSYKYLGRGHRIKEIERRLSLSWTAFEKLPKNVDIPICMKKKVYNQCV